MATAALRAIRKRFPAARITHLMRPYVAEVLEGAGFSDDIAFWPTRGHSMAPVGNLDLVRRLRAGHYDMAVLLTNSFRSAMVAMLAGIPQRVGYAREARGWLLTDRLYPLKRPKGAAHRGRTRGRFEPVSALDYYNDIARLLGCDDVTDRLELATTVADERAVDQRLGKCDTERPLVVLNPGANFGSAKCWPAAHYAELADALHSRFDARVVASLSPKERHIADELRATVKRPLDVFIDPPLGLGPLKALIRRAKLLITNDTGPRHFAAAFGVPVITIFGSSDPAWTDTRFALERLVSLSLDCQPCMQRVCPLVHHDCMRRLTPDTVLKTANEFLTASVDVRVAGV